jgi:hypothetical protein
MLPLKRLLEIGGWAAARTAVVDVGKPDFTGTDAEVACRFGLLRDGPAAGATNTWSTIRSVVLAT